MGTFKNKPIFVISVILSIVLLTGTSCENPSGTVTDSQFEVAKSQVDGAFFNPQPEPPAKIFEFELTGIPDGEWTGQFLNAGSDARMVVETQSHKQRGNIVQIAQSWMIVPPESIHPPDPITPVSLSVKRIINFANGTLVLNGMTEDEKAVNVHIRGQFITPGNGGISVGGEVMFNPQPEPPALN